MLSSVRNFFLALFISLIVFGISAYFLLGYINKEFFGEGLVATTEHTGSVTMSDETSTEDEENTGENIKTEENTDTSVFNALILGIDNGNSQVTGKKEADTIILINLNAKTKTLMISSLPCDMRVIVKGYTLRLGAVYGEYDIEMMIDAIKSYTGIKIEYYCTLDYESLEKVFEILGEIEYTVPMDMKYKPKPYYIDESTTEPTTEEPVEIKSDETTEPTTDIEVIDLESGKQLIDGAKAIQLMRYKDYSGGNSGRMITQIDFFKEIIRQKLTFENLVNAKELYTEIKESVVESNMDEQDFEKYAETLFSMRDFNIKSIEYPGEIKNDNGVAFFNPELKKAISLYKNYRKIEYIPEE